MAEVKRHKNLIRGFFWILAVLVPYIGIILVAPVCVGLTFLATGDSALAAMVFGVFAVVHFVEGNLVSPAVLGRQVDLNPGSRPWRCVDEERPAPVDEFAPRAHRV